MGPQIHHHRVDSDHDCKRNFPSGCSHSVSDSAGRTHCNECVGRFALPLQSAAPSSEPELIEHRGSRFYRVHPDQLGPNPLLDLHIFDSGLSPADCTGLIKVCDSWCTFALRLVQRCHLQGTAKDRRSQPRRLPLASVECGRGEPTHADPIQKRPSEQLAASHWGQVV